MGPYRPLAPPPEPSWIPDEWDLSLPFGLERRLPTAQDIFEEVFRHEGDSDTAPPPPPPPPTIEIPEPTRTVRASVPNPPSTEEPVKIVDDSEMPDFGDVRSGFSSSVPIQDFDVTERVGQRFIDPGFTNMEPTAPPPQPIMRIEEPGGGASWESADGSIRASMGSLPSREQARQTLEAHAYNYQPAQPPQPTTVTASRFDPTKEAFVQIGPPPRDAGVRESYSAVPYDPEGERIRAMEREMQDLELQKARQDAQDPLMRDRFKYEQERALLGDRAAIEQMSESERRQAFMTSIQEVDDQAAMAIARIKQSGAPDAAQRIQAVQERANQLKESRRAAFGVGARISSSELYKPRQPDF